MDFIINNYLWFGIAGVVLLMALIGFLAEKTNFIVGGQSSTQKKDRKKKKKETEENISPVEDTFVPDVEEISVPEDNSDETLSKPDVEVLNFNATGIESEEPKLEAAPLATDTWEIPTQEVQTDLSDMTTESTADMSAVPVVDEDLSQPFGDIPVSPVAAEEQPQNNDVVDEDIWKF